MLILWWFTVLTRCSYGVHTLQTHSWQCRGDFLACQCEFADINTKCQHNGDMSATFPTKKLAKTYKYSEMAGGKAGWILLPSCPKPPYRCPKDKIPWQDIGNIRLVKEKPGTFYILEVGEKVWKLAQMSFTCDAKLVPRGYSVNVHISQCILELGSGWKFMLCAVTGMKDDNKNATTDI